MPAAGEKDSTIVHIDGVETCITLWIGAVKNFIVNTLRSEYLLYRTLKDYRDANHKNTIEDLVAKAKRLDVLLNAEIEAITTEQFVADRRASLSPLYEGEDREVASAAKTNNIKVSSYGTETLTFRQAQRRLYNYCLASVKQHFPMLLDDVDVEAADHGTRALSNILEIVAPRTTIALAQAVTKYETFFQTLRSSTVPLYKFFEQALQLARVRAYYDRTETDNTAVVDRMIVAAQAQLQDSVLHSRMERFTAEFRETSQLLSRASALSEDQKRVKSNEKVRAFKALLIDFDGTFANRGVFIGQAAASSERPPPARFLNKAHRQSGPSRKSLRRTVLPDYDPLAQAFDPNAPFWRANAVSTPNGQGPCTWCLTFLGKSYPHDVSACRNKSNPAKLAQIAKAREQGQLQASAKKVHTCPLCNEEHHVRDCTYLNGCKEIIGVHQAKLAEETAQRGRTDASVDATMTPGMPGLLTPFAGALHDAIARARVHPALLADILSTPFPDTLFEADSLVSVRQLGRDKPPFKARRRNLPVEGLEIVSPGSEGFRIPSFRFRDETWSAVEQRRLARLATRVRHDILSALQVFDVVRQATTPIPVNVHDDDVDDVAPAPVLDTTACSPKSKRKRKRRRAKPPLASPLEDASVSLPDDDMPSELAWLNSVNDDNYLSVSTFDSKTYAFPTPTQHSSPRDAQLDSGATKTVTNDLSIVSNATPCRAIIRLANGKSLGRGAMCGVLNAKSQGITLPALPVIFHPELDSTLLSQPQMVHLGNLDFVHSKSLGSYCQPHVAGVCPVCVVHPDRITMHDTLDSIKVPLEPTRRQEVRVNVLDDSPASPIVLPAPQALFHPSDVKRPPEGHGLQLDSCTGPPSQTKVSQPATSNEAASQTLTGPSADEKLMALWHARLLAGEAQLQLLARQFPEIFKFSPRTKLRPCHACHRSSARRADAPPSVQRQVAPLEEIHMDLFFPDLPGGAVLLFLIDRASRYEWIYVLTSKGDIPRAIQRFLIDVNCSTYNVGTIWTREKRTANDITAHLARLHLPQRVKVLYADNAREHLSTELTELLEDMMIAQRFTIVESQRQNGLAEHNGGWRLMSQLRHDMDLSNLSKSFRIHALHLNVERRVCTPRLSLGGLSPFEILYPGKTPPFRYFKVFGASGSLLRNEKTRLDKCIPRAEPVLYVGTGLRFGKSGYLVYVPRLRTTIVAEHVQFDEHDFPARRQRHITDFTTALPGDVDPSTFSSTFTDPPVAASPVAAPAVAAVAAPPVAAPISSSPLPNVTTSSHLHSAHEPALVEPIPDLLDSDCSDDEADPESVRDDVRRTLERRRHALLRSSPDAPGDAGGGGV